MFRSIFQSIHFLAKIKFFNLSLLLFIAGVFLYAGIIKFLSPQSFLRDIQAYRLPLGALAEIAAYYLPPLEMLAALSLFWRKTRASVLLIISFLLVMFLLGLLQAVARGFVVDCGCFGASSNIPEKWDMFLAIARDMIFLGIVYWLYHRAIHVPPQKNLKNPT